jgi:nifR3 family TIM-barrel protein
VKKVAGKGAGAGMLRTPQLMLDITREVVKAVSIPVTVKTRLGWDVPSLYDMPAEWGAVQEGKPFIVELAERLQDCGIEALTIHGRTRSQMYQGEADWTLIGEVKRNPRMHIPIIGNGDIWTCYDAKRMLDETGCDAVMIGRAIRGNPWLVKQCIDYIDHGIEPERVSAEEKISTAKKHAELLVDLKGEEIAIPEMRSHTAYYLKNLPGSIEYKPRIFKMTTKKESFQRKLLVTEYNHISLIIKNNNNLKLYDCIQDSGIRLLNFIDCMSLYWNLSSKKIALRKLNISVENMENYIQENNIDKYENVDNYQIDKMSVNEIKNKFYQIINKKVENFIINNANSKYEFSICKFICSSKKKLNQIDLSKKNKYFCSELIACVYMNCNIMKKKYDPSTYLPKDFSEKGKIEFINGFHFGPETIIDFAY